MSVEPVMAGVQLLSTPPKPPVTVTAAARSLGILVQWSKVSGADGYNVLVSNDGDMSAPTLQVSVLGQNTVEYFYNTGHTSVTRFFAVQSFKGSRYSTYSTIVSATTVQAQANNNFPTTVTFTTETTIATVTLSTTGGTMLAIGNAVLTQAAADTAVVLKLKEDGAIIRTVQTAARADAALVNGWQSTAFNFSTPSAGSHTYILTATSGGGTCTASDIGLIVMEVPLLTMAAAGPPPSVLDAPELPTSYPSGPEGPPFRW